jgi:hypothetical protein
MIRRKWIEAGLYVGEVLSEKNGHVRVYLHAIGHAQVSLAEPLICVTIPLPRCFR